MKLEFNPRRNVKLEWKRAAIAEYWHAGEYTITASHTMTGGIRTASEYVLLYQGDEIGRFDTFSQATYAAEVHHA